MSMKIALVLAGMSIFSYLSGLYTGIYYTNFMVENRPIANLFQEDNGQYWLWHYSQNLKEAEDSAKFYKKQGGAATHIGYVFITDVATQQLLKPSPIINRPLSSFYEWAEKAGFNFKEVEEEISFVERLKIYEGLINEVNSIDCSVRTRAIEKHGEKLSKFSYISILGKDKNGKAIRGDLVPQKCVKEYVK